jgi:lipoprotein-releasing system ATP-binding protein
MVELTNVKKSYGQLQVLKGISLSINKGDFVSIVGASGAGKTTLLQIIGTLINFDEGNVIINNVDIKTLKDKELSKFRNREIGFVFQFHHLLPEFTALENTMLPLLIQRKKRKDAEKEAKEILEFLGLGARLNHKPNQLSGGEKQRAAIARAIITNPSIILADEPTGNLDSRNTAEIFSLFKNLQKEFKQTIIIVTHNYELANSTDKVFHIKDGVIIDPNN